MRDKGEMKKGAVDFPGMRIKRRRTDQAVARNDIHSMQQIQQKVNKNHKSKNLTEKRKLRENRTDLNDL